MKPLDRLRAQVGAHRDSDTPAAAALPVGSDVEAQIASFILERLRALPVGITRMLRPDLLAAIAQRFEGQGHARDLGEQVLDRMIDSGEVEEAAHIVGLPSASGAASPVPSRRKRRPMPCRFVLESTAPVRAADLEMLAKIVVLGDARGKGSIGFPSGERGGAVWISVQEDGDELTAASMRVEDGRVVVEGVNGREDVAKAIVARMQGGLRNTPFARALSLGPSSGLAAQSYREVRSTRTGAPDRVPNVPRPRGSAAPPEPTVGATAARWPNQRRSAAHDRALPPAEAPQPETFDNFVHFEERPGAGALCTDPRATLLDGDRRRVTCPRCKELLAGLSKDLTGVTFWGPLPPDERAKWRVTGRRGGDVWNAVVVEPEWEVGREHHFTEREIHAYVAWDEFNARQRDEHEGFFRALPEGAIVHYHAGAEQWVRARVIRVGSETKLAPEALVGAWRPDDSSARYWLDRIEENYAWRPHWTTIYETGKEGGRSKRVPSLDPRTLPPVDFSSPRADRAPHSQRDRPRRRP